MAMGAISNAWKLGKVQETENKQIQTLEFNLRQVVLHDLSIILGHMLPLKVVMPKTGLLIVHTIVNNLCSSILMDGIMQFVFHGIKEHVGLFISWVIARCCGINAGNLLVKNCAHCYEYL